MLCKGRLAAAAGLILVLIMAVPFNVYAGENLEQEVIELKQRIKELEKKVEKNREETAESREVWKEFKAVKEKFEHISIGGGVTGIVQSAWMDDDFEDGEAMDGSYSADLEIGIDMGRWGTGFLHLETGDGDNITDEMGSLTGTNADAIGGDNDLEVSEALWTFGFLENRLSITAGKLDPVTLLDDNKAAKDETTQFMADIFVDQIAMEWPDDYTPGLHLVAAPNELFDVKLAALSADTDWEDIAQHLFYAAEAAFHPEFRGLQGNYRFYAWGNDRHHIEWDDVNEAISRGHEECYEDESNFGFGLSFDQKVSSDITLFARYGWQDEDIAAAVDEERSEGGPAGALILEDGSPVFEPYGAIEQAFSIGGQITGSRWGRPNDVFGMAFGLAMLNDDYEDYLEDAAYDGLVDGVRGDAGDEFHFEAYYSFYLNEYIAISPDFQIIDNPRGDEDADTAYVVGLRTQMSF